MEKSLTIAKVIVLKDTAGNRGDYKHLQKDVNSISREMRGREKLVFFFTICGSGPMRNGCCLRDIFRFYSTILTGGIMNQTAWRNSLQQMASPVPAIGILK